MEPAEQDAEALRRRLYRPGASAADLSSYLHASAVAEAGTRLDESADLPEPEPGPSMRPFAAGAVVVAAAALLGGVLLSGGLTPPAAVPTAAPSATATGGGDRVQSVPATVLDRGRETHAEGSAVQEGPDRYRYAIASGDTTEGIADRFGVCTGDVLVALPYGVDPAHLAVGQTIELARLTSTTC